MPIASVVSIRALRKTVHHLEQGARYEWGHMGRCNAGHLVQTLTGMSAVEIVKTAHHQLDEWTEHANDYCQGTGENVSDLFQTLEKAGFSAADIVHLENLSDQRVLQQLPAEKRYLKRNQVNDVCLYMRTLADLLENDLAA